MAGVSALAVPQKKTDGMKGMLIAFAVVILILAFMWWMYNDKKPVTPNRSRAKKQSTKEMANSLYKRLDRRGGANDTTMRSLRGLGRKKT